MRRFRQRWRRWKTLLFSEVQTWQKAGLIGLVVILLVIGARIGGGLRSLEWMAFDSLMRSRPAETIDDRILVIGIDDQDIQQLNTYPVPDQILADLMATVQKSEPAAIGVDIFRDQPVGSGREALINVFKRHPNTFIINRVSSIDGQSSERGIQPPKGVNVQQVGFSNVLPDADGHLRRSLMVLEDPQDQTLYNSLFLQLALKYLEIQGYQTKETETLEFFSGSKTVAIPKFDQPTGFYTELDRGGYQTLLNFRSGKDPFRTVPLRDFNKIQPQEIRGKIVLIGMTARSVKDFVSVGAVPSEIPSTYLGVLVQAHGVSQIISTVLNDRPLLNTWSIAWEYVWIAIWGILGMSLGRSLRSPWQILLSTGVMSLVLIVLSYLALLSGWWIPLIPAAIVLVFNGAGFAAALFYRDRQELETQEAIRQHTVGQVFSIIHNGPLQQLARLIKEQKDQTVPNEALIYDLITLNQSLRNLETKLDFVAHQRTGKIVVGSEIIDLNYPLDELLTLVCDATLRREQDFPNFVKIQHRFIDIELTDDKKLSLEQKSSLCYFLEEALCNVGKHAIAATQLWVFCGKEQSHSVIRVKDNGETQKLMRRRKSGGIGGTEFAEKLEKQLGGRFRRSLNRPRGVICELIWK
ncbi:putative Sensor with Chase2 domain protein [Leptolyngbya sp. NIES-3755]|nr:putative Sensor with Chase2 domain protein [Leptolyngbya sp. NIES-3755]